jgi:hypothetical protein
MVEGFVKTAKGFKTVAEIASEIMTKEEIASLVAAANGIKADVVVKEARVIDANKPHF